jgi:FkbM family methyltransferase
MNAHAIARFTGKGIKAGLHHFGLDVVMNPPQSVTVSAGTLAALLPLVLRELDIDLVIDVGGHYGEYAKFLRRLGYGGQIVSLEPIEECFQRMQVQARADRRLRVYKLAAGACPGKTSINICADSELSSLLPPSTAAHELLPNSEVVRTEEVTVVTLDDLVQEELAGLEARRIFLKLDTQGWEIEAAKGAEGIMDRVLAVQTEMSFISLYDGTPSFQDSLDFFETRGFEVLTFSPVSFDYRRLVASTVDCLLVKPRV